MMSILVAKTQVPQNSEVWSMNEQVHYSDAYKASVVDPHLRLTVTDATKAFFSSAPAWVGWLMQLRTSLVKIIGLKTAASTYSREHVLENFTCEPGQSIGLFRVFSKSAQEVVMGEDDKHLDFRVSVYFVPSGDLKQELTLSTVVVLHNWLGRVYFWPVKFFHRLVVPAMLRAMVRKLERQHV